MNQNYLSVVAIHGVGNRKAGDVLEAVSKGLSYNDPISVEPLWKSHNGILYQCAEVKGHPVVKNIIEVSWDDLSHPPRNPIQLICNFFSVLASMLRVAVNSYASNRGRLIFPQIYQWIFITLFIWSIYPPLVIIGGFSETAFQYIWPTIVLLFIFLITSLFKPYDPNFKAGYVWMGTLLLGVLVSWSYKSSTSDILKVAALLCSLLQGLTALVLFLAVGEVWFRCGNTRQEERLSTLGLLYIPFALFSGVGALVWAGATWLAQLILSKNVVNAWSEVYLQGLQYDLPFMEAVFAAGVALCALLLLWPAQAIFRDKKSGIQVHERIVFVLRLLPWILIVVALLYCVHLPVFHQKGQCSVFQDWIANPLTYIGIHVPACPEIRNIYLLSATRLVPFIPWLLQPSFRNLLDLICDAMLYVDKKGRLYQPEETVQKSTRERFRNGLEIAMEVAQDRPIVVVAHSQGTVIAADVLSEKYRSNVWFVSLGSPIRSLYWRFLGDNSVKTPENQWLNFYRRGDYISGGNGIRDRWQQSELIDIKSIQNISLGEGGHGGYFEDKAVWEAILKWVGSDTSRIIG